MAKKPKEPKVKVGDRFGRLTVVEKVDIPIEKKVQDKDGKIRKEPTGRTKIGWYCKCDCGGDIVLPEYTLLKPRSALRSCNACPPIKDLNHIPEKITFEEKLEWDELYEYVKKNIFNLDKNQTLPKEITHRLLGLSCGKYMVNNRSQNNAKYSYKTLLNTFKFCSVDIQKSLRNNSFKNEQHKFNYIAKIIENNVNNVYLRMQNVEKAKEEAKNMVLDTTNHIGAEYQRKTSESTNKLLDDLW